MRIAIVNDLSIAVESLRRVLARKPEHIIAWVAYDGAEAVKLCRKDTPDLILMDLVMPVMDGVQATRRIMHSSPCPILLVTASVTKNSSKVFEAMGAGALDVVATPVISQHNHAATGMTLLRKIERIGKLYNKIPLRTIKPIQKTTSAPLRSLPENTLIAIGCSTGGPSALQQILSCLPENFISPIAIIQHMDEKFTAGLAEWLNSLIKLPVKVPREGERLLPGNVYLPSTANHVVLQKDGGFHYTDHPQEIVFHPSVDVFFESLACNWPGKCIGIILTGMGKDGANGLLALKKKGHHTIVQDRESSIVYGMPKAAMERGAADRQLPLNEIGHALADLVEPRFA